MLKKIVWACAMSIAASGLAFAAGDPAVGKAKTKAVCDKCHSKEDWADTDAATLETKIEGVVSGKHTHKAKIKLTDDEIKGVAAYWAGKK